MLLHLNGLLGTSSKTLQFQLFGRKTSLPHYPPCLALFDSHRDQDALSNPVDNFVDFKYMQRSLAMKKLRVCVCDSDPTCMTHARPRRQLASPGRRRALAAGPGRGPRPLATWAFAY
jgi:hypothetical protein